MKKVFLLLVLFSMISCEQDDNDGVAINKANISGKWYFESSRLNENDYVLYFHDCATKHDYIELAQDGTSKEIKHSNCTDEPAEQPTSWSLDGTTFTYSKEGADPVVSEVKILTEYKLSLIETKELPDGSVDVKVSNYSRY